MQITTENSGSLIAPRHLAIIMDGNGRWAESRGKKRVFGHQEGANAVRRTITECANLGVKELTLFAFSSENWRRPALEVNALMALFIQAIRKETANLVKNGIQTKIVGDVSRFPTTLQNQIKKLEEKTASCTNMKLNIAANYGGRWDILQAAKNLVLDCQKNGSNYNELSEDDLSQKLSVPTNVDLLIRTGGEQRVSNFLMWQSAYAELFFSKTLWPDFGRDDLIEAFTFFNGRERRFGMTSAQVQDKETTNVN